MTIVITIPAHNEAKSLGKVIQDIKKVMARENYKILVVDDGSTDGTTHIAKENGAIVVSHQVKKGLAQTFRTELAKCVELKAEIIVHIDADGQYLAQDIPRLIEEVKNGYDLVLGSRFKGKIEYMPLLKRLGNMAFSWVISNVTNLKISDAQTGFRAFTREVAEKLNITSNHTYTQEQIIRAAKQNFKIKEVPVYFKRRDGKSKLMKNPIEYAIRAWINLLRIYRDYQPLKFFVGIGSTFFSLGFLIGLYLLYLFLTTGAIGHVPLTILSMLLMLVGIQISLFGFLADMQRR